MPIKQRVAVVSCIVLFLSTNSYRAYAHQLIPDTTHTTGAILHMTPNDDPVAGTVTGIYYEMQSKELVSKAAITMMVESSEGGIREVLPVVVTNETVSSSFTFPNKNLYYLTLTVTPIDDRRVIIIRSPVRIIASSKGANPARKVPSAIRVGIVVTVWAFTALVVVGFKNRKKIIKSS